MKNQTVEFVIESTPSKKSKELKNQLKKKKKLKNQLKKLKKQLKKLKNQVKKLKNQLKKIKKLKRERTSKRYYKRREIQTL